MEVELFLPRGTVAAQCNCGYRLDFDCLPVSVQGGPVRTAMEICRDLKVQMDDPNRYASAAAAAEFSLKNRIPWDSFSLEGRFETPCRTI